MLKKILFAAAISMVSSTSLVSAQDFFFSFDNATRDTATTVPTGTTSATAFLFADENFSFNAADIDVSISGATIGASSATTPIGNGFTSLAFVDETPTAAGEDITFFVTSFDAPALGLFAPGQVAGVETANFVAGANGFLLGQIDFDVVAGASQVDFSIAAGGLGVGSPDGPIADVTFGTSTFSIEAPAPVPDPEPTVPEPSSAILLILGAAGMVARRKRS